MSSRKSRASRGVGGGLDDSNANNNNAPAPIKKKTQAEKLAEAQKWAEDDKKKRAAAAKAAAAASSSPAATATTTTTTSTRTTATTKVAAAATKSKRKRGAQEESAASEETAAAAVNHDDDDSPVAPRSAKKRHTDDPVIKPARTKAEKMAAVLADQGKAATAKNAVASPAKPTAASVAASTSRGRKQSTPPPPSNVAVAAAAPAAPSPSFTVHRPTRSIAVAATTSPTVATRSRGASPVVGDPPGARAAVAAAAPAVPAPTRAAAAAAGPTAAPVPAAAATSATKTHPLPISNKQDPPFGSPVGQNHPAAAAARRDNEDTISVPRRPPTAGYKMQQLQQQQQQGVVDVANALRSPGTAAGSAGGEQQQQQEAGLAQQRDPRVDSEGDSFNSDDSCYDSTDDDEDLLNEEEEETIVVPVPEQPHPVPLPPPPPAGKQSRFWFLAVGVFSVFAGIFLGRWLQETVLTPTNLSPCFADSRSFHYDDHVGRMVLVTTGMSSNPPYCQNEFPCPKGARCAEGSIEACPEFFQVAEDGSSCRLSDSSNQTLDAIVALLRKKSAADICRYFNPGQSGEMDWSKYEHNKGVGIFGIPSRRPLFLYHLLAEELEQQLGTSGLNLKLVNVADMTRVEASQVPIFVVQKIDDGGGGQVVIGLHTEQPVPRSSVCRAKHATAWIFIILIGLCKQLIDFISGLVNECYRIFWEDPMFVGAVTVIVILSLFFLRRAQKKHDAKQQRVLDIVSVREEVVLRLRRLAEQGAAGADSVVVDSQSLRDDIAWSQYSTSRAQRNRMEHELWPHVVADIAMDQRIQATQRVQNGQRRLFWSWRNSNVTTGGGGGVGTPVVSHTTGQEHHVRFQQQHQ